ncbi:hypothetical protein VP1G_03735 [Cytospora mali]|uniref:Uncharacterized protein n=1 Tax=Cytospora mali TaxID=578113 RepID=A0A194UXC9_CYTMA|nr:hypothetical protein VP1G_03735 [Valsa mali var. pyri (nom. inval.)]
MSSDNEPGDHAWGLDIIHDASSHDPSIDVIAVYGPGANDQEEDILLEGLHRQLDARIMLFGSAIKDGTDFLSPESLTHIAGLLLRKLPPERPLEGYTEALVMAESDAIYYSISQECNQVEYLIEASGISGIRQYTSPSSKVYWLGGFAPGLSTYLVPAAIFNEEHCYSTPATLDLA